MSYGAEIEKTLISEMDKRSMKCARERLGTVGLSQAGHCVRQLAYKKFNTVKPSHWGWRMAGSLEDGHDTHRKVRKWLRASLKNSCWKLCSEEREVGLAILDSVYHGHLDGILVRQCPLGRCKVHENAPSEILLEIKSCKDYEFKDAKKGKIKKPYLAQHYCYMASLGMTHGLMLYREKASGDFCFIETQFNQAEFQEAKNRLAVLARLGSADQAPREFGPNTYGELPFECSYCPYVQHCWKDYGVRKDTDHKSLQYVVNVDTMRAVRGLKETPNEAE